MSKRNVPKDLHRVANAAGTTAVVAEAAAVAAEKAEAAAEQAKAVVEAVEERTRSRKGLFVLLVLVVLAVVGVVVWKKQQAASTADPYDTEVRLTPVDDAESATA